MAHRNPIDRTKVQQWAQSLFALPNFYVLDTETTGIGKSDEIVQLGIIDKNGEVVMDTLVKPNQRLSREVIRVHGITNEMLADAPPLAEVYVDLSVKLAGAHLVAYNMDFDWRMLTQSLSIYKLPMFRVSDRHCAMKQYAAYRGVWNPEKRSYAWHNLGKAASHEHIEVVDAHSALGDVKMTLQLMKRMAGYKLMNGIFQKLSILQRSDSRLVLRELPLLDWLLTMLLLLFALGMWIGNFHFSAVLAIALALFLTLQARVRLITFTTEPNLMQVLLQSPLKSQLASEVSLHEISRAYLKKDDTGGTQIILVQTDGTELGLSVYSKDMRDWKEEVVIAINEILHNAHKDDPNREMMI